MYVTATILSDKYSLNGEKRLIPTKFLICQGKFKIIYEFHIYYFFFFLQSFKGSFWESTFENQMEIFFFFFTDAMRNGVHFL